MERVYVMMKSGAMFVQIMMLQGGGSAHPVGGGWMHKRNFWLSVAEIGAMGNVVRKV